MTSLKVLIADDFEQSGVDALRQLGCEVVMCKLKDQALADAVRKEKAEVLIVRSTQVGKNILEAPELALVVRAGAGVNTIDLNAASANGVYIANCPGKNAFAVAELAFGLILSLDRRIPENVSAIRNGTWNKKGFSQARGLHGRTLGVIGLGQIGKEVVTYAQSFGMKVVCWSRSLTTEAADELGVVRCDNILQVAEKSDVVSVHLALTKDTRGLIGKDFFDHLKPGTIFVNSARAEIVDEAAMIEAAATRNIRVGTDVPADEPSAGTEYKGPLRECAGIVYTTHHIGASTEQAQQAVADETVRIVRVFMQTGEVPNCVNLRVHSRAVHILTVRHHDRVGVLAEVLSKIRDAGVNVQEMENIFFEGADTACARIRVDQQISGELLDSIRVSQHVLNATSH
eukprot:c6715_g1_i1.p1 GENE.c6715_g1_i1~~c6715_g1_i1.p1  ORF type:complete len:400 (+),score=94.77 c6715_g1_i1:43-1242(+)